MINKNNKRKSYTTNISFMNELSPVLFLLKVNILLMLIVTNHRLGNIGSRSRRVNRIETMCIIVMIVHYCESYERLDKNAIG